MRADADTVKAADRLLDLSLKLADALSANCRITARAMWQTLQHELNEAVRNEPPDPGRFRLARARFNSIVKSLTLDDTAEAAIEFWNGFHDGIEDATMRSRSSKAYEAGYRSGNHKT